jgi:hypothetical protein
LAVEQFPAICDGLSGNRNDRISMGRRALHPHTHSVRHHDSGCPILAKLGRAYSEDPKGHPFQNRICLIPITVSLCNDMPMILFNMNQPGNILRVVSGERVGSLVTA